MCLPEDQCAVLPVKREIGDLYCAGAAVDGWGQPVHGAITVDQHISIVCYIKFSINATEKKRKGKCQKLKVRNEHFHVRLFLKTFFHRKNQRPVLLVLQYYIRQPHGGAGYADDADAEVLRSVPCQAIVNPLLEPGSLKKHNLCLSHLISMYKNFNMIPRIEKWMRNRF